jgi:hypothetical protein
MVRIRGLWLSGHGYRHQQVRIAALFADAMQHLV